MIFKWRRKIIEAVCTRAFVLTFEIFPQQSVKANSDLAFSVRYKIFDLPSEPLPGVDQAQLDKLIARLMADRWIRERASYYYLLESLMYAVSVGSDSVQKKSQHALERAKELFDFEEKITTGNLGKYKRKIKRDLKQQHKELKILISDRVEAERLKRIRKFPIEVSHFTFALTLFSSLFILSGIIYTKGFFWHFDVDVGNYFGLADFIQSSLDNLVRVTIVSAVSIGIMLYTLSSDTKDEIRFDLFEHEYNWKNSMDTPMAIATLIFTFELVKNSYLHGELDSTSLTMLIFFLVMVLVGRTKVFFYFKNPLITAITAISVSLFIVSLWLRVVEDVQEVKDGTFKNNYLLTFTDEYQGYRDSRFILSNSSYVFLWNAVKKEIEILPISAVFSFKVVPEE